MDTILAFALIFMALEGLLVVIFIVAFYVGIAGWLFAAFIKFVIRCTKPFR